MELKDVLKGRHVISCFQQRSGLQTGAGSETPSPKAGEDTRCPQAVTSPPAIQTKLTAPGDDRPPKH